MDKFYVGRVRAIYPGKLDMGFAVNYELGTLAFYFSDYSKFENIDGKIVMSHEKNKLMPMQGEYIIFPYDEILYPSERDALLKGWKPRITKWSTKEDFKECLSKETFTIRDQEMRKIFSGNKRGVMEFTKTFKDFDESEYLIEYAKAVR